MHILSTIWALSLTLSLSTILGASAEKVLLLDEDGDPLDEKSLEDEDEMFSRHRRLYTEPPSWWPYLLANFNDIDGVGALKRCLKRTTPPVDGTACGARSPKTCYFGDTATRQCPTVGYFPDVRCHCDGAAGSQTWSCAPAICPDGDAPSTPAPSDGPDGTCCKARVFGDPHFEGWGDPTGYQPVYEYHGECDLVLIKNDLLDLDLHIRTGDADPSSTRSTIQQVSLVKEAVLRIGTQTLEIKGGNVFLNTLQQIAPNPMAFASFLVYRTNSILRVEIGAGQYIRFDIYGSHQIQITIYGCDDFANSRGFLGTFCDEPQLDFLGRDWKTNYTSDLFIGNGSGWTYFPQSHVHEWAVDPIGRGDPSLFSTPAPANQDCLIRRRRLQAASATSGRPSDADIANAEVVCAASIKVPEYLNSCVFDVAVTGDDRWRFNPVYNEELLEDGAVVPLLTPAELDIFLSIGGDPGAARNDQGAQIEALNE